MQWGFYEGDCALNVIVVKCLGFGNLQNIFIQFLVNKYVFGMVARRFWFSRLVNLTPVC